MNGHDCKCETLGYIGLDTLLWNDIQNTVIAQTFNEITSSYVCLRRICFQCLWTSIYTADGFSAWTLKEKAVTILLNCRLSHFAPRAYTESVHPHEWTVQCIFNLKCCSILMSTELGNLRLDNKGEIPHYIHLLKNKIRSSVLLIYKKIMVRKSWFL